MKKALSLILALVMCLSLCACGKDVESDSGNQSGQQAVDKLINMIDELEVSLTSGKAISAAEKAYADLTAEQKNSVTNYQRLVDAKVSYERILNVFTLIEAIEISVMIRSVTVSASAVAVIAKIMPNMISPAKIGSISDSDGPIPRHRSSEIGSLDKRVLPKLKNVM